MFNGFGMSRRGVGRRFGSFIAAAATLAGLATAGLVSPAAADTTAGLQLITPAADPSKPVADKLQFAVIGDYGACGVDNCAGEQAVADMVHSWHPDAILTVGDNTYEQGLPDEIVKAQAPYKADIDAGTFFPIMGNHDYGNGCNPASVQPSLDYFGVPAAFEADFGNGLLDFLNPDANCNTATAPATPPIFDAYQHSVQDSTAAWTVSAGHEPVYSSGKAGNNLDRSWLLQPGVDLLLAGHDHDSEHITTADGYNIAIDGAGGNGNTPIFSPVQGSLFRDDTHLAAIRMTVTKDELHAEYVATTGQMMYYFTLKKDANGKAYVADRTDWTDPTPPAPVTAPNQPDVAFDSAVDSAGGLTWQNYEDGPASVVDVAGTQAVQLQKNTFGGANQLYLKVDDNAVSGGPYDATATVIYRSSKAGSFTIQHDSALTGSAYQKSDPVTIGADQINTWQTATIDLPQTRFTNRENGGSDMRINAPGNLPLAVRSIAIHVKPLAPVVSEVSLSMDAEPEGINYLPYESGPAHQVTIDGRLAWQLDRNTFNAGNNFYLTVDDDFVKGGPYDAVATIEYRSPVAGSFVLQYDSAETGSAYQSSQRVSIGPDQVNQWLETDLDIRQARFNNRQNGGADMRLVGANNLPLVISDLRMKFGESPLTAAQDEVGAAEKVPAAAMIAAAQTAINAMPDDATRAALADRLSQPRHAVQAAELLAGIIHNPALGDKNTTSADLFAAVDEEISARNQAAPLVADLSGPVTDTDLAKRLPDQLTQTRELLVTAANRWLATAPVGDPPVQVSDQWLDLLAGDLVADKIAAGADPSRLTVDQLTDELMPIIRNHASGVRVEAAVRQALDGRAR